MATIESKKVTVNAGSEAVYTFLSDLNNFEQLLPQDRISEWSSTEKECSFKVQGGYKIGLQWERGEEHSLIVLKSTPAAPFPFDLNIHLSEEDGKTNGYQVCNADLNPFLKMMVEKPLKNLFDYIADRLVEQF